MPSYAGLSPQAQANLNYNPETFGNLSYGASNPVGAAGAINLGGGNNLTSLSELINSITRAGQSAALNARIPNAAGLEAASSANIGSELQGELPADVLANLRQAAAERGVATGSPASPNSNAAYLRALGLTSLDLTRMGQQELTAAEGRNPAAPVFDPTSQLLTPYQAGTLGLEEERQRNELLLARQRLATQAALGGRGGGGGQPEAAPDAYVRQPFAADRMVNPPALLSPYATTGATGAALFEPYTSTGTYNYGVPQGPGSMYIGPTQGQADETAYWNWMLEGMPDAGGGGDQSGGPEGQ